MRIEEFTRRPLREHETVALLKSAQSAAAAAKLLTAGELDESRREELRQLVERGRCARSQLVAAYLSNAEYQARRFATARRAQPSTEDLTQEALLGLLRAIETFNPQAGYRFGCFAELHMHEAVRRSLIKDARRRRDLQDSAA